MVPLGHLEVLAAAQYQWAAVAWEIHDRIAGVCRVSRRLLVVRLNRRHHLIYRKCLYFLSACFDSTCILLPHAPPTPTIKISGSCASLGAPGRRLLVALAAPVPPVAQGRIDSEEISSFCIDTSPRPVASERPFPKSLTNTPQSHVKAEHSLTFISEFPSLSNNQPQPSQSTWAGAGARFAPTANLRMQQSTLSSQQQLSAQQQTQQQQDDLFSQSSQLPSSTSNFRFGNQNAVGQASQTNNNADEFPPLNRNANGEIGQDRNSNMVQGFGFGGQSNGLTSANPPQPNRSNGLLDALSSTSRVTSSNRVTSPASLSGNQIADRISTCLLMR
jgi:hypothetical protein